MQPPRFTNLVDAREAVLPQQPGQPDDVIVVNVRDCAKGGIVAWMGKHRKARRLIGADPTPQFLEDMRPAWRTDCVAHLHSRR